MKRKQVLEIEKLANELATRLETPRHTSPHKPISRIMQFALVAGLMISCAVAAFTIHGLIRDKTSTVESPRPLNPRSSNLDQSHAVMAKIRISNLAARLRNSRDIESIHEKFRGAQFAPVSSVQLNSQPPTHFYCLLRAQLDDFTEEHWKVSGMLRDENIISSPYLRLVTIDDNEALMNLFDWHVESVAPASSVSKPPNDPKE